MPTTGPLAETLARVGRLGGEFVLWPRAEGGGWLPAGDFVGDRGALREALRRLDRVAGGRTSRRALGSTFALHYLRYLWPAVAALSLERRVPDMAAENVMVRIDDDGWPQEPALVEPRFATLASDPRAAEAAYVARDDADLFAWALRRMVDDHAAPLVRAVRLEANTTETILWGSVAAACALPLFWGVQLARDREAALRDLPLLLEHPTYPQLHDRIQLRTVRHDGCDWTVHTRRTCCLYRRLPPGHLCEDCPVLREPEATELIEGLFTQALDEFRGDSQAAV
jgi:ferric iron reductase protein FhuF